MRRELAERDAELERVHRLAKVLDRYHLDPLLGFVIPGVGDVVGSVLGLYAIVLAVRRRVSPVIVARMLLNLAVDAALGIIPVAGDLFDLGHRAHTKNAVLLAERAERGGRATVRDWLAVVGAALALVLSLALAIYAAVVLVRSLGRSPGTLARPQRRAPTRVRTHHPGAQRPACVRSRRAGSAVRDRLGSPRRRGGVLEWTQAR